MLTLADLAAHRASLEDLTTLAIAELVKFWRSRPEDPRAAASLARELLNDTSATYGLAAGAMAADWYEELRAEAGAAAAFAAGVETPGDTAVQDVAGWGLAPMFNADVPDADAALSRLSGGLQMLVADADRLTIITNARRDPMDVRYARHASANACAFCAMVATRQAVYRSEDTAGSKYHRSCRCIAFPVWPGQEVPEAPYVSQWRDSYYSATEKLGGASDEKSILALMRADLGTN